MKIALVQVRGDNLRARRFAALLGHLDEAAGRGAKLCVLPELFLHPYFCRTQDPRWFDLAHGADAGPLRALAERAGSLGVVLVLPFFEKRAAGLHHNSALVVDADGSALGLYRKNHVPHDPGFNEKYYFAPGDLGYRVFATAAGRVGVLICWDQWFPEAARATALLGCEVLVYPSAIAWDHRELKPLSARRRRGLKERQLQAWRSMHRAHAIANGVWVAAVNRIGREGHLDFWGNSLVLSPMGEVVAEMGARDEGVLVADCNPATIEETRRTWPFLRDRRIDTYSALTRLGGE